MDQRDILLTMIAEAFGEGDEGMRRVGETILNRAAIRGIDPSAVVRQPHQYTGYSAPGPAAVAAQQNPAVMSAAQAAWELARQPGDPTDGADHYHADYVNPGWASAMPSTGTYGQHKFYKSTEVPAEALAALLTSTGPRIAPTPAGPLQRQFAFENAGMRPDLNAPPSLISDTFNALPKPQQATGLSPSTVKSVVEMFAEPVRNVTPRLNRSGGSITDPADIVFGKDMTTALAPSPPQTYAGQDVAPASRTAITSASAKAAADLLTMRGANQSAADAERNRTVVASLPTAGVGKPPATRSVQSIAVPAQTAQRPQSYAGQQGSSPTAVQAIAQAFGAPQANYNPAAHGFATGAKTIPGPNAAPKTGERLAATAGAGDFVETATGNLNPYGAGALPFDTAFVPPPRKRPERTITERVPNPDWTADLATKSVPAGMKVNFGSRDTVAQRGAGITAAKNVPQFITRTRQVPVAAPAAARVAPVPFDRPAQAPARAPLRIVVNGGNVQPQPAPQQPMSAVQQFQSQGMSPSQAYDAANQAAVERAIAGAKDPAAARRLNERSF